MRTVMRMRIRGKLKRETATTRAVVCNRANMSLHRGSRCSGWGLSRGRDRDRVRVPEPWVSCVPLSVSPALSPSLRRQCWSLSPPSWMATSPSCSVVSCSAKQSYGYAHVLWCTTVYRAVQYSVVQAQMHAVSNFFVEVHFSFTDLRL